MARGGLANGLGAAGKGDVRETAACGVAGDASMRTPCLSSAASLSPRGSGGDSSSEEKDAPAGASPRGAGGDTGGSRRGGIDAATPPPRSRSSGSASRGGRDPPPSFLMPVTRFTSRPSFPIAECARDRLAPAEAFPRDSFRRSPTHPNPRGVELRGRTWRSARVASRSRGRRRAVVARRFRSEKRVRLGGFKTPRRVAQKRDADRRDLNRDGHNMKPNARRSIGVLSATPVKRRVF